jgi:hypothetical protein
MTDRPDQDDLFVQRRLAAALDPVLPGVEAEERILRRWRTAAAAAPVRSRRTPLARRASWLLPLVAGLAMAAVLALSIWAHRVRPPRPQGDPHPHRHQR